jgi:hypothetical protein
VDAGPSAESRAEERGSPTPRVLVWLALPVLFYLVPLTLGYGWNSLYGPNVLNPPEGYSGRLPDMPVTAEHWGAAVITVPFHARLRYYMTTFQLPLWNPYQGLGQPFAAQGEGSPYFPLTVLRALLPYSYANHVTFLAYYLSAVFLFLFLRGLGLGVAASVFGGTAWELSGALSLHIARDNYADQFAMAPVVFWAAARAVRADTIRAYAVLAAVSGLHVLGGHIQIGMLTTVGVLVFGLWYAWLERGGSSWSSRALTFITALVTGIGLGGFHLLPILEASHETFNKNALAWASPPQPLGNVIALFFPLALGIPFSNTSWVPGGPYDVVNWDNLFAFSGSMVLLIAVAGYTVSAWRRRALRMLFLFFSLSGALLVLRYMSVPPVDLIDLLPPFSQQTRKHANGLTVLCFVVAAAISVDHVEAWQRRRRAIMTAIVCGLFAMLALRVAVHQSFHGRGVVEAFLNKTTVPFVVVTVAAVAALLMTIWLVVDRLRLTASTRILVLAAATAAELALYIPLGTRDPTWLYPRLAVFGLGLAAALMMVCWRRWLAGIALAMMFGVYAWVVVTPPAGLAVRFDADSRPTFLRWLKSRTGDEFRTLGVFPDFSAIAQVQDLAAVGPMAPRVFFNLIDLIADDGMRAFYKRSAEFMLAGKGDFSLENYRRYVDMFDWLGVKYVVLDRTYFNEGARTDHRLLAGEPARFREVFRDGRVTIFESAAAEPKAVFYAEIAVYPSQGRILEVLHGNPGRVRGWPMVEAGDVPGAQIGEVPRPIVTLPLRVERYDANRVSTTVDVSSAGVVVWKDAYAPGWQARLNGQVVPILRVNGLVRGVRIPSAGQWEVDFAYRPGTFGVGVVLAVASALMIGMAWAASWSSPSEARRGLTVAAAGVAIAIVVALLGAYFSIPWKKRAELLTDTTSVSAVYLQRDIVRFDLRDKNYYRVSSGDTHATRLRPGEVVLAGSHELLRVEPDTGLTTLVAADGRRIRLRNVGVWDAERQALEPLEAVSRVGRWFVDSGSGHDRRIEIVANRDAEFREGPKADPMGSWALIAGPAGHRVMRLADEEGPFVRVVALGDASVLAVAAADPLSSLADVPVTVVARMRAHGRGEPELVVWDERDHGDARIYRARTRLHDRWTTLVVRVDRTAFPSPKDRYRVGLAGAEAGSWFDVREFSLYVPSRAATRHAVGAVPGLDAGSAH